MDKNIACIILTAGKGKRMKSKIPKVLHLVCGRPMAGYTFSLAKGLKIKKVVAVLGHKHAEVRKLLEPRTEVAIQKELRGTGDAVKQALPVLKNFHGTLLVLYADNPLLKADTVNKLLKHHTQNTPAATLLTATINEPAGYGRVLRDKYSGICGIVEDKDADEFQKGIKEINTGIVCFNKDRLSRALKEVRPDNRKKEYYLTDIVGIFYKKGYQIESVNLKDSDEALGINSRSDLARANSIMQQRINKTFMENGVSIVDPASSFISYGARIGEDTVIYPFTVIEGDVKIGKRCIIGPFAHLRKGTCLGDDVWLGNFLEVVRSKLGSKTLIKHFAYLGDAIVGRQVNIGAGTVTANFDGRNKYTTVIKDKAFIGSDTVLVAPVRVGKSAKTGAGAVLIKKHNVPDGQVVVGIPAKPLK